MATELEAAPRVGGAAHVRAPGKGERRVCRLSEVGLRDQGYRIGVWGQFRD